QWKSMSSQEVIQGGTNGGKSSGKIFDQNASSQSPFVSGNTPMLHDQMSVIEIRPLRSMDDVALILRLCKSKFRMSRHLQAYKTFENKDEAD
ncbi:MAG: hypothetical protein WBW78_21045, partial [Terrimicrobiaceae bacterium]